MNSNLKNGIQKRRRATIAQQALYVEYVKKKGLLRSSTVLKPHGYQVHDDWDELVVKLNSCGAGPQKTKEQWKKSFADWRSVTKKKLQYQNAYSTSTGNSLPYENNLTELEAQLLMVIGNVMTGRSTGNIELEPVIYSPIVPATINTPTAINNTPTSTLKREPSTDSQSEFEIPSFDNLLNVKQEPDLCYGNDDILEISASTSNTTLNTDENISSDNIKDNDSPDISEYAAAIRDMAKALNMNAHAKTQKNKLKKIELQIELFKLKKRYPDCKINLDGVD